ncbi:hypothetical protein Slin15195_G092640 [Septoria linicola]|uniref:Uncharacterized protein n=1 Tax=Septoria linicola TaxID=215465 RepID=A0A9Q9B0K0_9PEZI|nr:hypothetical protein Slin15195_G092640 [Septoria linicola]
MSDNDSHDAPPAVLFRANKRRKVIRKRDLEEREESTSGVGQDLPGAISDQQSLVALSTVRRPVSKRHGIGFSSVLGQQPTGASSTVETSVVPFQKQEDETTSNDRFTKPTGKAEVVEDKHLTAYIDSKLAELRSSSVTPAVSEDVPGHTPEVSAKLTSNEPQIVKGTLLDDMPRNHQSRKNTRRATNKPPRRQRPKDASELAREAMIDQILGETQVPMYDQSSSTARVLSDTGVDNDEAAAEAFKADFLAGLEEQNRRRPAASSTAAKGAAKGAAPVPSGPKLGGSRAQREKMRAIEEAKTAGGAAKR